MTRILNRRRVDPQLKAKILSMLEKGEISITGAAVRYSIWRSTLRDWCWKAGMNPNKLADAALKTSALQKALKTAKARNYVNPLEAKTRGRSQVQKMEIYREILDNCLDDGWNIHVTGDPKGMDPRTMKVYWMQINDSGTVYTGWCSKGGPGRPKIYSFGIRKDKS